MSFNDVIKNSVLEALPPPTSPRCAGGGAGHHHPAGRVSVCGVPAGQPQRFYSRDFNKALALMPVITAAIAASTGTPADGLVVRSIRRVPRARRN